MPAGVQRGVHRPRGGAYGDPIQNDAVRNDLCEPIPPHPDVPIDWLRILFFSDNRAQIRWLKDPPELIDWLKSSRLNVLRDLFPTFPADRPRVREKAVGALTVALDKTNERLAALMHAG